MQSLPRWLTAFGVGVVIAIAQPPSPAAAHQASAVQQAPDPKAQAVLAAAREAMGIGARTTPVKSFAVDGSMATNYGEQIVEQALRIRCELPDKFVRERTIRTEVPGGVMEITHRDGFNAEDLIGEMTRRDPLGLPPPPDINPPRTPEESARARERAVAGNKQDFAKLGVVLFAASLDAYPVVFTYAGQAALDPGTVADVLEAKGPDGFTFRLFVNAATRLPAMVTWQQKPLVIATQSQVVTVQRGRGVPPAGTPPPPVVPPPPARALKPPPGGVAYSGVIPAGDPTVGLPLVEHQLSLDDYRTVDGLTWPHRFTDRVEGQVAEEMKLARFRINPKIDAKTFNPSK